MRRSPQKLVSTTQSIIACVHCTEYIIVSAFLNITRLYHDTLLSAIIHKDPKFKPILPPSPNSRYTRSWTDRNTFYKWASRTLEVIRYVELVIEMGLRRKASRKNRWRGVFLLEFIKYVNMNSFFTFVFNSYRLSLGLFSA